MSSFKIFGMKVNDRNAKSLLNNFLSKEGLKPAVFSYNIVLDKKQQKFRCTIEVTLPSDGKKYFFETVNPSKKKGSAKCAFNILLQIAKNNNYVKDEKKKTHKMNDEKNTVKMSVVEFYDDPELSSDIKVFYKFLNIKLPDLEDNPKTPVIINSPSTLNLNKSVKNKIFPQINDCKNEFVDVWFPPKPNYNCWLRCSLSNNNQWYNKTLSEISRKLIQMENKKTIKKRIEENRKKLHVFKKKLQIIKASECNQILLIKSNKGSGKSTQVVKILLKHYISTGRGSEFNCIRIQPRRLSAISLAKRVAKERGENLGKSVGYCVRFEKVLSRPFGSILFGTVGVILRKFSTGFKGISHIIVDEVHERTLKIDFLLIILKLIIQKHKKLKIILMSATIDTKKFENYFQGIKIIEFTLKSYEIKELYLDQFIQYYQYIPTNINISKILNTNSNKWSFNNIPDGGTVSQIATYIAKKVGKSEKFQYDIIIKIIKECAKVNLKSNDYGSILVFVPGWIEIFTCIKMLKDEKESYMYWSLPLYSNLSLKEQNRVFQSSPYGKIKIVISKNIAENSITIDDVLYVIDSYKQKVQTQCQNITTLISDVKWASKFSMKQRKGRVGRTRPGYYYCLVTKEFWNSLPEQSEPEIKSCSLQSTILDIKALRLGDSKEFFSHSMEEIDNKNILESEEYLMKLSALDKNCNLNNIGRIIQSLPLTLDIGKCVITSVLFNLVDSILIISGNCRTSSTLFKNTYELKNIANYILNHCGDFISDHLLPLILFKKYMLPKIRNTSNISQYIKVTSLEYISKVKSQLSNILQKHFKDYSCVDYRPIENKTSCPPMHVIMSFLVNSFYPNVVYQETIQKLQDANKCLLRSDNYSILSLNKNNFNTRSPFILYSQKVLAKSTTIKECSVILPLQILLFESSKATYNSRRSVMLDECYLFNINFRFAQMVLYLKLVYNNLLNSYCAKRELNEKEKAIKYFIRNLIKRITAMAYNMKGNFFKKIKLENPTKVNFKEIGGATTWS